MTHFSCKTAVYAGAGSLDALKSLGSRRLLLVTDGFFLKNGMAQRVLDRAAPEQKEVFSRIVPDPPAELVAEGTRLLLSFRPDTVVALGGGSTLDCAKAMVYFSHSRPRLVAIPTTSGSGSEMTDFAIVTQGDVKVPLIDPVMQPDLAILDGELLTCLPPALIADGGFDALTHALEAYTAKNANAFTDALARDAFSAIFSSLPGSFAGDTSLRQSVHTGAAMAGLAFSQAGLGLCHALSHALGGSFHVPHGRLNAILLPAVISCNAPGALHRYGSFARSLGLGGSADTVALRNLKNALIRLRRQLKLPETLAQVGISREQLQSPRLIRAVLADPCCETNPVPVGEAAVKQALEEAYHG